MAPYILYSIYNNFNIHYHKSFDHKKIKIHLCGYAGHILKI